MSLRQYIVQQNEQQMFGVACVGDDFWCSSACLELDQTAQIISYEEYHPYGTTSYRSGRTETEVSLKRYKYVGKERDEETGLYYYGARYYAAWICRFVSVDPLQFDYPYYTPYQYAGNKPITYIDLDGLEEAKPKHEIPYDFKAGVYIHGDNDDDVQTVYNDLQAVTRLGLMFNNKTGQLTTDTVPELGVTVTVNPITGIGVFNIYNEDDMMLYEAITSEKTSVNYTINAGPYPGAFMGVKFQPKMSINWLNSPVLLFPFSISIQSKNPISENQSNYDVLKSKVDDYNRNNHTKFSIGLVVLHEITEGYQACLLGIILKVKEIEPAYVTTGKEKSFEYNPDSGKIEEIEVYATREGKDYWFYNIAHNRATIDFFDKEHPKNKRSKK